MRPGAGPSAHERGDLDRALVCGRNREASQQVGEERSGKRIAGADRIDDATGAGSVADYKNKEIVRVYDNNADTAASFTAANKADLGAYTYQAQQQGDSVVLQQKELTDSANMALSINALFTSTR